MAGLTMGLWATAACAEAENADVSKSDEIIVTAGKRDISLQDLASSVSVISEANIVGAGISDITDFARTVPSLSFTDTGPGQVKPVLRGIAESGLLTSNVQATVAQYIDEMIVSDSAGAQLNLKLFDVQRIEVLRGPQGTLYGGGSMGGAIRFITNQPQLDRFAATVEGTLSSTHKGAENFGINAMLNVPLIADKLAVRGVFYTRQDDGYIDNITLGKDNINNENTWGGRVSVLAQLSENFDATATLIRQTTKSDAATNRYSRDVGDLVSLYPTEERLDDAITVANLTLNYDFGGAKLTSSSSYLWGKRNLDFSYAETGEVNTMAMFGFASFPNTSQGFYETKDRVFTQEVRLASKTGGDTDWIVGAYYQHIKNSFFNDVTNPELFDHPIFGTYFLVPLDEAGPNLRPIVLREDVEKRTEQLALFGEFTWHFAPEWSIVVGGRAFKTKFRRETLQAGVTPIVLGSGSPYIVGNKTKETRFTPKVQLEFRPSSDLLFYALASQGYRVGGVNPTDPLAGASLPPDFQSDSLWNYEFGTRAQFLDGRVTLNAAAFYMDWTDIQVPLPSPSGFALIGNAGKAHSAGIELELSARPTDMLELGLSGAWIEAELDETTAGLGTKGDRMPATPEWSGSAYAQLRVPVKDEIEFVSRLDYQRVGKSYLTFTPLADTRIGDYGVLNARIGLEGNNWSATVFANNLTDERPALTSFRIVTLQTTTLRPRTIGITLRKAF
ncbi:MAG: TonB-dependent receptor [Sphingosinicella sp.]|nr:TonB-dependent receptor [Sphingosinicella sp.]